MVRTGICLSLLAFAAVVPARAALPRQGVFVPGRSLGGVRLGETGSAVGSSLGREHGVCRGCATTTWYFTYRPFDQHGLGVELSHGRVSGVYTLWRPSGWHEPDGLGLGAFEGQVTASVGPLVVVDCTGYHVLVSDMRSTRSAYYIVNGRLWAFGLFDRGADPCR